MMKIINAFQGMGDPMTEEETKNYMPNSDNSLLLIPLGLIDEKGEPIVVPLAYYFDDTSNKIYINTLKTIKKVRNLRKKESLEKMRKDTVAMDDVRSPKRIHSYA